jgi:hypothetical protein
MLLMGRAYLLFGVSHRAPGGTITLQGAKILFSLDFIGERSQICNV